MRRAFLGGGPEWDAADDEIIRLRDEAPPPTDDLSGALERSVKSEIAHCYRLWRGDYERAYQSACDVVDTLSGGAELRPYRAYWHYAASTAADLAYGATRQDSWRKNFLHHTTNAAASARGVHWFYDLARSYGANTPTSDDEPSVFAEIVSQLLSDWQITGPRFEKRLNQARQQIGSDDAEQFEAGLLTLGRMLGCDATRFGGDAAPDGLWLFTTGPALVFEAKTDEGPDLPLDAEIVRQANTHPTWIRSNYAGSEDLDLRKVVISHHATVQVAARGLVDGDMFHVSVDSVRQLFSEAATLLNEVRKRAYGLSEEELRTHINEVYRTGGLAHEKVRGRMTTHRVADLPIVG